METFLSLKNQYTIGALSKSDYIRTAFKMHRNLFDYPQVLSNSDISKIEITESGIVFHLNQHDICMTCPEDESRCAPLEILNFGRYEPMEVHLIKRLAKKSKTILDIGANIGFYSVLLARYIEHCHVYAFEPMPTSFEFLRRNVALNKLEKRVTFFNLALSDSTGTADFFVSPSNGTNASLRNVAQRDDAATFKTATTKLDSFLNESGLVPDFIKCDTEGSELLVFKGALQSINTNKPVIFTELLRKWSKPFGYHPNELIEFFKNAGYHCFAVGINKVQRLTCVTDETVETNYIFLHETKHSDEIKEIETLDF